MIKVDKQPNPFQSFPKRGFSDFPQELSSFGIDKIATPSKKDRTVYKLNRNKIPNIARGFAHIFKESPLFKTRLFPIIEKLKPAYSELNNLDVHSIYEQMSNHLENRILKKVVKTAGRQPQPAISNETEFKDLFTLKYNQTQDQYRIHLLKESFMLFLTKDIFESWIMESHLQHETKTLYMEQYGNIKRDMSVLLELDYEEEKENNDSYPSTSYNESTPYSCNYDMDIETSVTVKEEYQERRQRTPSPIALERIVDSYFNFNNDSSPNVNRSSPEPQYFNFCQYP